LETPSVSTYDYLIALSEILLVLTLLSVDFRFLGKPSDSLAVSQVLLAIEQTKTTRGNRRPFTVAKLKQKSTGERINGRDAFLSIGRQDISQAKKMRKVEE
jgi:hypothetical protein